MLLPEKSVFLVNQFFGIPINGSKILLREKKLPGTKERFNILFP